MQFGTVRTTTGTTAVRVEDDSLVALDFTDVGDVLRTGALDVAREADGERLDPASAEWASLVVRPSKIICVGLNYADHVAEMGSEPPAHPTCFSKFGEALIGANDDLQLPDPEVSTHNDWEAELAIVVGLPARRVKTEHALDYVAGYTAFNDFSVRDWQKRTSQFLLGKTFEGASALGPVLSTVDELGDGSGLAISSSVNGVTKQSSTTDQLVFDVRFLMAEISKAVTLMPGDIIATGTPGGVGAARTPPEWLVPGDELTITIEGIGTIQNTCVSGRTT